MSGLAAARFGSRSETAKVEYLSAASLLGNLGRLPGEQKAISAPPLPMSCSIMFASSDRPLCTQRVTLMLITRFHNPPRTLHLQALWFAIPSGRFKYWPLPSALIYGSQKTPTAKINYTFFPPPLFSSGSKMSAQDQIHMVAVTEDPISEENTIILSGGPGATILQPLFKIGRFFFFSQNNHCDLVFWCIRGALEACVFTQGLLTAVGGKCVFIRHREHVTPSPDSSQRRPCWLICLSLFTSDGA